MLSDKTSLRSRFEVNGEFDDEVEDTRFLNVTIDILHTGKNKNMSIFEKGVVNDNIDSIKNTPVLGFIKYNKAFDENDFKGHEHMLVKSRSGVEDKYIGSAFGLIPESCNPRWRKKMCDDGEEREFLQVDALMWEKFSDATEIMRRDGEKSQSMELQVSSIDGYEDTDGYFHFEKFKFDGACILGDDVEPAMFDSTVKISEDSSQDEFSVNLLSELNKKFETFNRLMEKNESEGGVDMTKKNDEEFEEVEVADAEVEPEGGDVEAVAADENDGEATENAAEADSEGGDEEAQVEFSISQSQIVKEVADKVRAYATFKDRWGWEMCKYGYVDIQDNEAIIQDFEDWNIYSVEYSMSGDNVNVDFETLKRKKVVYEDFDEGDEPVEGELGFGEFADMISENIEKASKEFDAVKAQLDEIKPKYDEYVEQESKRVAEAVAAEKDAKFSEYEDVLGENPEFSALKEQASELTVDEIDAKCAIMYVRAARGKNSFSAAGSTGAVVGVINDSDDSAMEGYVATKYGNIRHL